MAVTLSHWPLTFSLLCAAIPLVGMTEQGMAAAAEATPAVAVGPQYDSAHIYVAPQDMDRFVTAFLATFGGQSSPRAVATVTPTPSLTLSQILKTPVGIVSLFGYTTPIPAPFGTERTGYLVTDLDAAVAAARATGAEVIVEPFADHIGRDAIIRWPGGVSTQLYWHTTAPSYPALQTVPENRVYVSADRADDFTRSFLAFSHGKLVSDEPHAPGIEIGRPGDTYRRIRMASLFGKMTVLVTDGHLPYPYGNEMTGYEVADLAGTLAKAQAAGVAVLVQPFASDGRHAAIVQFPGGAIVEIHAPDGA
jgi:predicted enzyme related to lactoylglutathione lyase